MNTREQILVYLRRHPLARVRDMAQALQVTPADVRHHLAWLQAAGLVEVAAMDSSGRRGRPAQRYRLTTRAQAADWAPLTRALLLAWRQKATSELGWLPVVYALLGETLPFPGNLRQRLQRLMERLGALGYEPHWEAHHRGPEITLRVCPFASLREEFPELCLLDRLLLEYALGFAVEPLSTAMDSSSEPPIVCRFRVQPR